LVISDVNKGIFPENEGEKIILIEYYRKNPRITLRIFPENDAVSLVGMMNCVFLILNP
jgi:uncharacterized protein YkuJ